MEHQILRNGDCVSGEGARRREGGNLGREKRMQKNALAGIDPGQGEGERSRGKVNTKSKSRENAAQAQ